MRDAAPRRPARRRSAALAGLAVLGVVVLTDLRVALPPDLGSWAPAALPGQAVFALEPAADGLLVGSPQGLQALQEDGSLRDLGVRGPVQALVREPGQVLVGTGSGLVRLPGDGPPAGAGLTGTDVRALSLGAGTAWAGTATGLHRRTEGGGWERTWPAAGEPDQPVAAVLAVDDGVLFAAPGGLAHQDAATLAVRVVAPGVEVVSLVAQPGAARLWAGLFRAPLLLLSEDGGRTWQPRSQGLGFTAVNVVRPDPDVPGRLVAGGSGIADGTGNAGTQTSDDTGRTWQVQQGQLSNTHVFALQGRTEALRVRLRLAGLPGQLSLALPVRSGRAYAGTNGGGVYTRRPEQPVLTALAPAAVVLRRLEPVLAGLLLLACVVPAFRRLADRSAGRPPPRPTGRSAPAPAVHDPSPEHEERA